MNDISEKLYTIANSWPVFFENHSPDRRHTRCPQCDIRMYCEKCEEEIPELQNEVDETIDIIGHLMRSHGYRMNGKQYDNQNQEIPDEE